jgi:hypothetical protein
MRIYVGPILLIACAVLLPGGLLLLPLACAWYRKWGTRLAGSRALKNHVRNDYGPGPEVIAGTLGARRDPTGKQFAAHRVGGWQKGGDGRKEEAKEARHVTMASDATVLEATSTCTC